MKSSHNLAGEAVDAYYLSNRILDAKKLLPNRFPGDANVRCAIHVILREDRSFIHIPSFDVEVFGRNAAVGGVPILIAIDDLNGIIHIRRDALDERDLVLDGHGISHHQRLRIVSAGADAIDRPASGFNPDKVVSQVVEVLLDSGLPGIADGNYTDDSGN